MSLIPKKNPHDLTGEEVAFLRGASIPGEPLARVARAFGIGAQTLGNHQAHAGDPLHAARIAAVATRRLQTIQTITKEAT